jgi:hypothetical protein
MMMMMMMIITFNLYLLKRRLNSKSVNYKTSSMTQIEHKKKQQVLSTIVLMLDVITSFNFLFFPNDGLKK